MRQADSGLRVSRRAGLGLLLAVLVLGLLASSAPAAPKSDASSRALERLPDRYIVVFRPSVEDVDQEVEGREHRQGFHARFQYEETIEGFAAKLSPQQAERLRSDPEVAFVSPDRPIEATGTMSPGDTAPSGVARMEAAASGTVRGASGAGVAVLDSGIDLDHPDLNAVSGTNCVGSGPADDDNGHGTHVAGTIAARNDGAGVVGVAPDTRIYAAKVLDASGGGSWSQIICGIDWVTSTRADSDPANDISVVNMSLGGPGAPVESCTSTTDPLHKAICRSTAAGVTYVAAAGNSGWDFDYAPVPDVPAAYPEVLAVTAVSDSDGLPGGRGGSPACASEERDDRYASFSNYAATTAGAAHAIAAPGVCIRSTSPAGGYATMSGTSMAAPHVAGSVALCLDEGGQAGACAGLSPAGVIERIRGDAKRRNDADNSYGFSGDPAQPVSGRAYGYLGWAGSELPAPVTAPVTKSYRPTGYALAAGSVYSGRGSLSRLYSDDSSRVEISAAKAGSTYVADMRPYASIPEAERAALDRLSVSYDGNATSSAAALSLRIYNYASGSWQTLDGPRTGVTSDRSFSWSNSASPTDYVSPEGKIQVSVRATRASYGFRTRTDLVNFEIAY